MTTILVKYFNKSGQEILTATQDCFWDQQELEFIKRQIIKRLGLETGWDLEGGFKAAMGEWTENQGFFETSEMVKNRINLDRETVEKYLPNFKELIG